MQRLLKATILFAPLLATAQFNLQQHYDIGRGIQTSTAEFFSATEKAVVFAFIDINYDTQHFTKSGATDIWYELAWYQPTPLLSGKLNASLQYNDGLYFFPLDSTLLGSAVQPAWLAGISYPFQLGEFVLPVDLLLRQQHGDDRLTFQATVVWFIPFNKRFTFTGFADIWTNATGPAVSLTTEPQLLVNHGRVSLGLEIEISRGFAGAWTADREYFSADGSPRDDEWWLIPTVFFKYTF
ncbi:MAG: DUF5020 family protein [Candidatus Neomarinimicrobiota bacterium]